MKYIYFRFIIILFVTKLFSIDYGLDIQPIFDNHCTSCHSGFNPSGGLNLTDYDNLMAGGDDGPVINPGSHAT